MIVRDIMSRNVKTVRPDDTVRDAVRKMNKFRIGSVVVVNSGRPTGIITERNIHQSIVEPRHDPSSIRAKVIMTQPLITIDPNTAVEEAAPIMANNTIKTLPVIEKNKILGILTSSDIVKNNPTPLSILDELLPVG